MGPARSRGRTARNDASSGQSGGRSGGRSDNRSTTVTVSNSQGASGGKSAFSSLSERFSEISYQRQTMRQRPTAPTTASHGSPATGRSTGQRGQPDRARRGGGVTKAKTQTGGSAASPARRGAGRTSDNSGRTGGRRGGRGRGRGQGGTARKPALTKDQLDADLEKYHMRDPEFARAKLDSDLDAYMADVQMTDASTV